MKKVLITGVNGFIGRNLVQIINNTNLYDIIGSDLQSSYLGNEVIKYIQSDISEMEFAKNLADKYGVFDVIIHMAACLDKDDDSSRLISVNCQGIQSIIRLAKYTNIKRIIFISSIPLIGEPVNLPITELHFPQPRSVYHATKLFGEHLLNMQKNLKYNPISLRLSSPIGIGMNQTTILPVFLNSCKKNDNIILYGQGLRRQNFIDVRDICSAIITTIEKDITGVFNIASNKSYSNYELAQICIEETRASSKITYNGLIDSEESHNWDISIQKAQQYLDFKPIFTIRDSIKNILLAKDIN